MHRLVCSEYIQHWLVPNPTLHAAHEYRQIHTHEKRLVTQSLFSAWCISSYSDTYASGNSGVTRTLRWKRLKWTPVAICIMSWIPQRVPSSQAWHKRPPWRTIVMLSMRTETLTEFRTASNFEPAARVSGTKSAPPSNLTVWHTHRLNLR